MAQSATEPRLHYSLLFAAFASVLERSSCVPASGRLSRGST